MEFKINDMLELQPTGLNRMFLDKIRTGNDKLKLIETHVDSKGNFEMNIIEDSKKVIKMLDKINIASEMDISIVDDYQYTLLVG